MSRIGKLPVILPAGVTVEVAADNTVSVKGPLGTLSQKVDSDIKVEVGVHTDAKSGKELAAVMVTRPPTSPVTVHCTVCTARSSTIWLLVYQRVMRLSRNS